MPVYTDQMGLPVNIPLLPQRIVSLVPSITELLYHLELHDRVAGITKFCVHPSTWFRTKQRVGGTKSIKADSIRRIQPDLIIANKEENLRHEVEALALEFPVFVTDVDSLESALEMIAAVGSITGTDSKAADIVHKIRASFATLAPFPDALRTCYLIWRNPLMTIGGDTFIHDMLRRCGLHNLFGDQTRYPDTSWEALQRKNCELLILSSEPYPFKEKHINECQEHLPDARILLADGEMFSWYGSRLLQAPAYFKSLLERI